jgi:hypothetical protein
MWGEGIVPAFLALLGTDARGEGMTPALASTIDETALSPARCRAAARVRTTRTRHRQALADPSAPEPAAQPIVLGSRVGIGERAWWPVRTDSLAGDTVDLPLSSER